MKKAFCDKCGELALPAANWNQNVKSNLGGTWKRTLPEGADSLQALNMAREVQPYIKAWIGFHWVMRSDGNTELDLCGKCAVELLDAMRTKLLKAYEEQQTKESA